VPALYPATGHEVGVDYHSTGADFANTAFLTAYHSPSVRSLVKTQLAGMASAGATVVSTRIWLVVDAGTTGAEAWKHHFPLSQQELDNVRAYAQDVAAAGLKLYLVVLYLWCAEHGYGTPATTLGHCGLTATAFVGHVQTSVKGLLAAVRDIYLPGGRPVVERLFLDGEVMTAADGADPATQWEKKNQRWFLKDSGLWAWFWGETRKAGLIPSLYFIHGTTEAEVLDAGFVDGHLPALTGHRSMYWIYRTLKFLKDASLPLPDRIDFSSYHVPQHTSYATMVNRVFADYEACVPALLGGPRDFFVAETHYFPDQLQRRRAHKSFAAQFKLRPGLRGVTFWTTPDAGGTGVHVGYPFDLGGLSTSGIIQPSFANPGLETTSTCGAGDGLANPAGWCTEWPNGNVTSWQIGQSSAAKVDGAASLRLYFGQCATAPCSDSAYPGIYALSDAAAGVTAGSWALLRLWARYDGSDHASGAVLIDNSTAQPDEVRFLQSSQFVEYVLLGPVASTDLRLRAQVSSPTAQGTTTYVDLLH
jgi:hypothetical protein